MFTVVSKTMRIYTYKGAILYIPGTIFFLYVVFRIILTRNSVYRFPIIPANTSNYVCQTFNGRLGNHMFQYASIYGISKLNGLTVLLGKDDDLAKYFEVPSAEIRRTRDMCLTFRRKMARFCCVFDKTFMNLPKDHSYKLGEYLQSWRYFWHVRKDVRKELTFKETIRESVKYIVNNYREAYSLRYGRNATVVGIHIRRGDILWDSIRVHGNNIAPDTYIHNAVNYMKERFGNLLFIVCSDEMSYAREAIKGIDIASEFINISPSYDLAVLASCDHMIITVGSFGWWAGFMSGGLVVYYKYPMKEGSSGRIHFNYSDYFPPDWIGLAEDNE